MGLEKSREGRQKSPNLFLLNLAQVRVGLPLWPAHVVVATGARHARARHPARVSRPRKELGGGGRRGMWEEREEVGGVRGGRRTWPDPDLSPSSGSSGSLFFLLFCFSRWLRSRSFLSSLL